MFEGATAFNGNLSKWNVYGVIDMTSMFKGATAFDGDISTWNVSKLLHMNSMFQGATAFTGKRLGRWKLYSGYIKMMYMFENATALNTDLSSWNVRTANDYTRDMFKGATAMPEAYKPPALRAV